MNHLLLTSFSSSSGIKVTRECQTRATWTPRSSINNTSFNHISTIYLGALFGAWSYYTFLLRLVKIGEFSFGMFYYKQHSFLKIQCFRIMFCFSVLPFLPSKVFQLLAQYSNSHFSCSYNNKETKHKKYDAFWLSLAACYMSH